MKTVAEPSDACPKCRRNPLFLETSGFWGDRVYCLCGYSSDLPTGWRRPVDKIEAPTGLTGFALASNQSGGRR
jgi:hypothetical protein